MAFIQVVVDGKVAAERPSTFGVNEHSQKVLDAVTGKNFRATEKTSRQRRKEKSNA